MTTTLALFDLNQYYAEPELPRVIDPSWDEVVLDCSGKVEPDGQVTLFYDADSEPPEPDDYPTPYDYQQAWIKWEKKFPEIAAEIQTKFKAGDKVVVLKCDSKYFGAIALVKQVVRESVITDLFGTAGVFHWSELELIREAVKNPTEVVLEKLDNSLFTEGGIYWHSSRTSKFKITKIFHSVGNCQGYFAGEIVPEKISLSELSPLAEEKKDYPEQPHTPPGKCSELSIESSSLPKSCATKEAMSQSSCAIDLELNESCTSLPEQEKSVLEKSKINQWVETYYVSRSGAKYWYYRYCYYQKRIRHIHLPGGRVGSLVSDRLKQKVEKAIALGNSPEQIQQLIKNA